LSGSGATAR
ncbi:hypothetical protein PF004_g31937, partial [Phytophthora fragariae]